MAPLWAIGVTRRRLAALELARALGLAALTALLALPLGLALAWVLTAVVNVRAFGWRLPVLLLPGQWVDGCSRWRSPPRRWPRSGRRCALRADAAAAAAAGVRQ